MNGMAVGSCEQKPRYRHEYIEPGTVLPSTGRLATGIPGGAFNVWHEEGTHPWGKR